jgi:predicted N-acetyltransferase YhbS
MPDMLVPLYRIPSSRPIVEKLAAEGIIIRRGNAWELSRVREFIEGEFGTGWADEASVGFANKPVTTYIAVRQGIILGFGSYECTRRAMFGPTGVAEEHRKQGIGAALLLVCLEGLAELGYAYAVIGGAGPTEFYAKACGATIIPDSVPGIYTDMLKAR